MAFKKRAVPCRPDNASCLLARYPVEQFKPLGFVLFPVPEQAGHARFARETFAVYGSAAALSLPHNVRPYPIRVL